MSSAVTGCTACRVRLLRRTTELRWLVADSVLLDLPGFVLPSSTRRSSPCALRRSFMHLVGMQCRRVRLNTVNPRLDITSLRCCSFGHARPHTWSYRQNSSRQNGKDRQYRIDGGIIFATLHQVDIKWPTEIIIKTSINILTLAARCLSVQPYVAYTRDKRNESIIKRYNYDYYDYDCYYCNYWHLYPPTNLLTYTPCWNITFRLVVCVRLTLICCLSLVSVHVSVFVALLSPLPPFGIPSLEIFAIPLPCVVFVATSKHFSTT